MQIKLRKLLLILLSIVFALCCLAFVACNSSSDPDDANIDDNPNDDGNIKTPDDDGDGNDDDGNKTPPPSTTTYDGLFAGTSNTYVLDGDYTITAEDVAETDGDGNVTLNYACTFDLNGHTLDLNQFELKIADSSTTDTVVFKNGTVKNGDLNISVPNGDIEFKNANLDSTVTYELEAASETIRFSNAILSGKCTVVSNTSVKVEYSTVSDITLAGDGTLTAGNGASLGAVTISENASGAAVIVTPAATVTKMDIQAAATVAVAGTVNAVKVAEKVKNDENTLSITVDQTANVDIVELNAAADVTIAGAVTALTVAETVQDDTSPFTIVVAETASVEQVELNATADVTVNGEVKTVVVAETAGNSSVTMTEKATVSTITVNAENIKVDSHENANVFSVVVADTIQSIDVTGVDEDVVSYKTADEIKDLLLDQHTHIFIVDSRVEPTCEEEGVITYVCYAGDGATKTDIIPALGHQYVYLGSENGIGIYKCIICGDVKEVEQTTSFTLEGLSAVFSQIPDGTYTLKADEDNLLTVTQGKDITTLKSLNAVLNVENGVLNGTLNATIENKTFHSYYNDYYEETVHLIALIDGNNVYFYEAVDHASNRAENSNEFGGFITVSGAIKMLFRQATGYDLDELGANVLDFSNYLQNITLPENQTNVFASLIDTVLDATISQTTSEDGVVYSLYGDSIIEALRTLGGQTLEETVNGLLGEEKFDQIISFAEGLPDMTVGTVVTVALNVATAMGVSEEQAYILAAELLTYATGVDFDAETVQNLATSYSAYTVAEAIAEILNGEYDEEQAEITADDIKEKILSFISQIENCKDSEISDLADDILAQWEMTYDDILNMIESKIAGFTAEITISDGTVVAYSLSYVQDETTLLSIIKGKDATLPAIDFNIMGAIGSFDETEDGYSCTLSIMDITVELALAYTDDGAEINVTVSQSDTMYAESTLTVTVNENSATLVIDGQINAGGFGETVLPGADVDDQFTTQTSKDAVENVTQFSGTLIAEKKDDATIESAVRDQFEDDKSLFYQSNLAFRPYNGFDCITLTYVNDETGEYYLLSMIDYDDEGLVSYVSNGITYYWGRLVETKYVAKIAAIDGMPEALFTYTQDCGDWIELNIIALSSAEGTITVTNGTYLHEESGLYTAVSTVSLNVSELGSVENKNINGQIYLNRKTGETATESQHQYVYSGEYLTDSQSCEDGLLITAVCSICGNVYKTVENWHYYNIEYIPIVTQCGDQSYIAVNTCIMDDYQGIDFVNNDNHMFNSVTMTILTETEYKQTYNQIYNDVCNSNIYHDAFVERLNMGMSEEAADAYAKQCVTEYATQRMESEYVKLDDLKTAGFDVDGFYFGTVELMHCAICGLNVYEYDYYTSAGTTETCKEHIVYDVVYNGNSYFEALRVTKGVTVSGHHSISVYSEYTEVSAVIREVEALVGALPFTPDYGNYTLYKCGGCNLLFGKSIYWARRTTETHDYAYAYIDIDYNEDGTVSYWGYRARNYDLNETIAAAAEYSASLSGAISGDIHIQANSNGYKQLSIYLGDGEGNTLNIVVTRDTTMTIEKYVYLDCTVYEDYYLWENDQWVWESSSTTERHYFVSDYRFGENCTEDGWTYYAECIVCHKILQSGEPIYEHIGFMTFYTDEVYSPETGLTAIISADRFCTAEGTVINATITLLADWTLTHDVYLKAEGLTIDLNGHTIDLNGYNLVIYSYAGEHLTITDNSFDTSEVENFDPDTYNDYDSGIINTNENGVFVLFNYYGDITIGTIYISVENSYISDSDNRETIADNYYDYKGEWLPILTGETNAINPLKEYLEY